MSYRPEVSDEALAEKAQHIWQSYEQHAYWDNARLLVDPVDIARKLVELGVRLGLEAAAAAVDDGGTGDAVAWAAIKAIDPADVLKEKP